MPEAAPSLHLPSEGMGREGERLDGEVTGNKAPEPWGVLSRAGCGPGHVAESGFSTIQPRKPCLGALCGTGQAPRWKKRAAPSPQRAPYKIRNPSFLRMCSEPSRWLLWTCQNISVWSHPCFSINKSIFGLLATISECYKRDLPSKVNSPSPPPWALLILGFSVL